MVTSRSEEGPPPGSAVVDRAGGGRRGSGRRRTTRQLLTAGVSVTLVVLAALSTAGGLAFSHASSIDDELLDRQTPALVASVRLESDLLDQETGVRGYGLTGQRDFLTPYRSGLADQAREVSRLDILLRSDPGERADLRKVLDAAGSWQRRVADPVVSAPSGAPVTLTARHADEGKQEFDAVRAAVSAQQGDLTADRDRTRARMRHVDVERDVVLALIIATVLVLTILVFTGLRRGVTAPLEQLSRDVRTVARGDFGHEVARTGPADLARLASDVDAMRRRLAEELAFTNEAREQLDEQANDLRRSNAELEQFAYVASHDLQEPLRKVASFCQLLERRYADQLDERAGQYIAFAVDGANRMQGLINDLLAFSRVGRLHTEHTPVDLEELFRRTEDALSISIEEAGAEVTHDPLPTVAADSTQLGMVLQNLLSNAVKFRSPDRPSRVHVGVERRGDRWRFSVTDNGIGIDQVYAEKVFVIFQRLHTRDAYPGNGIGLALCKKIVEYHGGTIGIDADHTQGASIAFTLPVLAGPSTPEEEDGSHHGPVPVGGPEAGPPATGEAPDSPGTAAAPAGGAQDGTAARP